MKVERMNLIQTFQFSSVVKNNRQFSTQAATQQYQNDPVEQEGADPVTEVDAKAEIVQKMKAHYPGLKVKRFPQRCLTMNFENDILAAEQQLIDQYGFLKEEINFIMKYKPSFILHQHQNDKDGGIKTLNKFFVEKKGFDIDTVRTLVVRYPYILGKSAEDLDNYFNIMAAHGINDEQAMKTLIDVPKLISKNLDKQMKEIFFLFNLYHGISEKQVMEIFEAFPYLFCCEIKKIQRFMGEFKKYKFTNKQIIKLCKNAGGILASKVSNFVGLFDYLRLQHKMKASEVVEIIDHFPEFVYQNKKDLLQRKISLIIKNSKCSEVYIRTFIRRHPDILLKSWASMEAKVNYVVKQLGRPLVNEKTFPMLLHFNYSSVIRPRCDLLKDKVKHFEFEEVLPLTDEQFCLAYDIPMEELERKKNERPFRDEKDTLWAYVPGL